MENTIYQEAEFEEQVARAAEFACEKHERETVCIYSGRLGTLIFPDLETALEAARAAAVRFDLFAYQDLGLSVDIAAVEGMVRDNCVPYYNTRQEGKDM